MNNINQNRVQISNRSDAVNCLKPKTHEMEPAFDALLKLLAEYALAKA